MITRRSGRREGSEDLVVEDVTYTALVQRMSDIGATDLEEAI